MTVVCDTVSVTVVWYVIQDHCCCVVCDTGSVACVVCDTGSVAVDAWCVILDQCMLLCGV